MDKKVTADELEKEWSPQNPNPFSNYSKGSHYYALWVCAFGHEWPAEIKARYRGNGCPFCSGRLAIPGENDLATLFPEIAAQWNYEKNGNVRPCDVKPKTDKNFYWICKKGHTWPASPATRTQGKGCPFCEHRIASDEYGLSLAAQYPEIAKEWDYEANEGLSPDCVLPHSNKYVFWKCAVGHKWRGAINVRTRSDRPGRCPWCTGKKVIPGETDILSVHPEMASEWDYERNKISPEKIACHSKTKMFWICRSCCRSYKMSPNNKVLGKGCPKCAKDNTRKKG